MNDDTKSYESYQMLARLLNSERKENIDKAYNALLSALNESYKEKTVAVREDYRDKKNALARNRAKAEKYLGYFMTEKGYENSGIEADAKMKAQIGYNSDMAALERDEERAAAELLSKQHQAQAENSAGRAKEKSKADADLGDQLGALKKEQDKTDTEREKLRLENSWKEAELEYKKLALENDSDSEKIKSYRYMTYLSLAEKASGSNDRSELRKLYDSVTGVNMEQATEVLGYSNYKNLIKVIEDREKTLKKEEESKARIESIYNVFVSSNGKEYHGLTYKRLVGDLKAKDLPAFTREELDEAYDRFREDLNNGVFDQDNG